MLFKYFSASLLSVVFQRAGHCGVKCSEPSEYNDPYELFLGADLSIETEDLAAYRDIVQTLPQYQTTCFSHSPVVSPMWAHYANNHTGFALGFDESYLTAHFDDAELRDVEYRSGPAPELAEFVKFAANRAKPRDAYRLRAFAIHQAYFSKYTEWTYEQECRLTGLDSYVENVDGTNVLFIPLEAVNSVIVGCRASDETIASSQALANENGLSWYRTRIGKSYPAPYLTDATSNTFVFDGASIGAALKVCGSCQEPFGEGEMLCAWCRITDDQQWQAASRNPFRILDYFGELENYLEGARQIGRRNKPK
jgi:hypothetical protein